MRRVAFLRDTGFTADPKIQVLGDEYGACAPLVIEELMALAKLEDRDGAVTITYATLARRAFTTPAKVKRIISDAASVGLVELGEANGKLFSATFLRWSRWQPRDPTAAARQARYRETQTLRPDRNAERNAVTVKTATRNGDDIERRTTRVKERPELLSMSQRLANGIRNGDPKAKVTPESLSWLEPLRLLIDVDGRSVEEAERAIDLAVVDDFWSTIILSPRKLRKHFPELIRKAKGTAARPSTPHDEARSRRNNALKAAMGT